MYGTFTRWVHFLKDNIFTIHERISLIHGFVLGNSLMLAPKFCGNKICTHLYNIKRIAHERNNKWIDAMIFVEHSRSFNILADDFRICTDVHFKQCTNELSARLIVLKILNVLILSLFY